jgi:hypothetical protein
MNLPYGSGARLQVWAAIACRPAGAYAPYASDLGVWDMTPHPAMAEWAAGNP